MKLPLLLLPLVAGFGVTAILHAATGTPTVYDDADGAGFNHNAAACGGSSVYNETAVVHSGSAAVSISKFDSDGAGWAASTS